MTYPTCLVEPNPRVTARSDAHIQMFLVCQSLSHTIESLAGAMWFVTAAAQPCQLAISRGRSEPPLKRHALSLIPRIRPSSPSPHPLSVRHACAGKRDTCHWQERLYRKVLTRANSLADSDCRAGTLRVDWLKAATTEFVS